MMTLNLSVGFLICITLLGLLIFLYLYDPEIFLMRIIIRTNRIKFILQNLFTKAGKASREKWRKLNITIQFCETAISKYVNKKKLSSLKDDETLKHLLLLYRTLLDMQANPEPEFSLEQIQDIWQKVEDLYFPDMDPYYDMKDVV